MIDSPGSALHGLTHQYLDRSSRTRVYLVVHHVLETLVVRGPDEHLSIDLASGVTVVHHLVASQLVTVLLQQRRDLLHVDGVVERSRVTDLSLVRRHLIADRVVSAITWANTQITTKPTTKTETHTS